MRSKFLVAVHLFFLVDGQVLLSRRFNTGYEDGKYSVVAGHPQDVRVVHVMNRKSEDERIDFFVVVERWAGEITNNEPQKCDDLAWFPVNSLPHTVVPYVQYALARYQAGVQYSELGW
jgi:8-oxo-dGTP diphosphatase